MATQAEIIAKYEGELQKIKIELVKYEKLFKVAGLVDTEEQKKLHAMQLLIDKDTKKLLLLKEKDLKKTGGNDNVDYEKLIGTLNKLSFLKGSLERYYYNDIYMQYHKLKPVGHQYNIIFNEEGLTKAKGEVFIKAYDDESLKKMVSNKYGDHETADKIRTFFSENGGAAYINTLKKDSEDCMALYAEDEALAELIKTVEAEIAYYNETIAPNRAAMLTTVEEITRVKGFEASLTEFVAKYDAITIDKLKEKRKERYDNYKGILLDMPNKIKLLEEAKQKALKKDVYAEKLAGMREEDQIKSNPDVGKEKGAYIKKGKEPKPGKPNKVDQRNENSLKYQGAYDKKTKEYDMYEQGEGDVDEVDINDVKQGALGDCYLISAIAGVAKDNPSYIKKLITYKEKETFATVKLYIRGSDGKRTAKSVKVDFYFPVSGVKAAFAKAGDGELWVMVIEKAYAKLMGGYDSIGKGGDPAEALAVLTGNEAIVKEMTNDDVQLGTDLASVVVDGKSSVAGTKERGEISNAYDVIAINPESNDGFKVALSNGNYIFCSHAYTVIGVDATAKKVKLRNPHGGSNANLEITFQEFRDCFNNFKVVDVPSGE